MKNVLILVVFSLIFSCCTKKYASSEIPEEKITFGSGGGFSGYFSEYVLLKNGQLFEKKQPENKLVELESITKRKAKSLFEKCDSLNLSTMDHVKPDNYSHYIEVTTTEHSNRVSWGKKEDPISGDIKAFFQELKALPSNNKNTK